MAITAKKIYQKLPLIFGVDLTDSDDRLDCAWLDPIAENKIEQLRRKENTKRKLVKLKIVADIGGGKRLPKGTVMQDDEVNVVPYIRGTEIKNLKVNIENAAKITKEIHQGIQNYQLQKDDVVITIVGTIGEVGIVENDIEVCDFTENVARVRINNENVLARFILHFLDSSFGRIQTKRFSVGSLQYKLSLQSCRNIEIYLPISDNKFDLKEQKQILDSAYSLFSQAEQHIYKAQDFINQAKVVVNEKLKIPILKEDIESKIFETNLENNGLFRLDALFNNPFRKKFLSILKKYPHKNLGSLTKPQPDSPIVFSDYYRLVELEQIDENTGRIIKAREVPQLGSEKVMLRRNSILISKLQPEKGKVAIVSSEFDGCVGSSEFIQRVLNTNEVSLEYLLAILRSEYVLKQWEYELTGSSRMRIGPNEIKNTIIPIVDSKTQSEIVSEIENKVKQSDEELKKAKQLEREAYEMFEHLLFF